MKVRRAIPARCAQSSSVRSSPTSSSRASATLASLSSREFRLFSGKRTGALPPHPQDLTLRCLPDEGSSVPELQLWPQFLQRLLEPSAIEHVEMLVRHRVWVVHVRDLLHAYKQLLEALLAIIHEDHTFTGVIARSPQEIALVTADRPRQSKFRPEEIDRAGYAKVRGKDRRLRSNIRRQTVVNTRHRRDHFRPAKLARIILRQGAQLVRLTWRRRDVQRARVANVRFDRQHRRGQRRSDRAIRDQQCRVGHSHPPSPPRLEPHFPQDAAGGEHQRKGGIEVIHARTHRNDHARREHPGPAQRAKSLTLLREKEKPQACQPHGRAPRVHRTNFLTEEAEEAQRHVPPAASNVGLQFEKWKVVPNIPPEIRRKNHKRDRPTNP